MASQTETSSNQYGFYAVPKKLEPKKKYREEYEEEYDEDQDEGSEYNTFDTIDREALPENEVEKDFYVDEAPYPEFKPKESGLDYGVQIERGDLFDYDLEVQPLLEILVGRSVVSAINELQEEKEKKEKKEKVDKYQKKRNAELMVTQRMEAKAKRKQEESERRVLQKEVYVKNSKEAGRKIIARKNGKKALLGLKNEIFSELNEAGYLRSEPYNDLRINYEGWLYEQVTSLIGQESKVEEEVTNMVKGVSDEHEEDHKKYIEKEKARRQAILNEQERKRKENEERKERKRIRKQKKELNAQREPKAIKMDELLEKYENVDSIIRYERSSNGFTSGQTSNNSAFTVYISGGLWNFFVALLNSCEQEFTSEEVVICLLSSEIEKFIEKLLNESGLPVEISFTNAHYDAIQGALKEMEDNPNDFMKSKSEKINELKNKIALDLRLLEANKIAVKSSLNDACLEALLNILLSTTKVAKEGQQEVEGDGDDEGQGEGEDKGKDEKNLEVYKPSSKDKEREELKKKIELKKSDSEPVDIDSLDEIMRVRFERKYDQETEKEIEEVSKKTIGSQNKLLNQSQSKIQSESQKKIPNQSQSPNKAEAQVEIKNQAENNESQKENKTEEEEWIDVYDGQGWNHICEEYPSERSRETQRPASYLVTSFENSFIYDERILHFLQRELENLLSVVAGTELKKYTEELGNLHTKAKKNIPVYDGEIRKE